MKKMIDSKNGVNLFEVTLDTNLGDNAAIMYSIESPRTPYVPTFSTITSAKLALAAEIALCT